MDKLEVNKMVKKGMFKDEIYERIAEKERARQEAISQQKALCHTFELLNNDTEVHNYLNGIETEITIYNGNTNENSIIFGGYGLKWSNLENGSEGDITPEQYDTFAHFLYEHDFTGEKVRSLVESELEKILNEK